MSVDPEKRREQHRRYNRSEKGRARSRRYEERHIVVFHSWEGLDYNKVRVPAPTTEENRKALAALQDKILERRVQQAAEMEAFADELEREIEHRDEQSLARLNEALAREAFRGLSNEELARLALDFSPKAPS